MVVGGGLVGLSAALRVQKLHPQWKITVIDRHPFGGGGSTRNAGFACFGSATELREDRLNLGDDVALELVRKRLTGLQLLREQLGDSNIGYRESGSVELFLKGKQHHSEAPVRDEIHALNNWISPATGIDKTFVSLDFEQLKGVNALAIEQAISSPLEGCVDTGKMMQALKHQAVHAGINVINGCHVTDIQSEAAVPKIRLSETPEGGTWFETERLLLTTNAFTRELMEDLDVHPASNLVLVTEPLEHLTPQPTVHLDAGYVYARSIGNRLLIGGGRHWETDNSLELESRLMEYLSAIWPQSKSVKIQHRWTGVLGIGKERLPIIKTVKPNIHVAVRLGGMGVSIGMQCGHQVADIIGKP